MGRKPSERDRGDPRVTDLRAYRRERDRAARAPAAKPARRSESLLGANPRAGLILAVVVVIFALLSLGPIFL
ncbi:MAG: hypothetical protein JNK30_04995 [Phenylobacterium sp.]|uniref:hypothetical protein n=1 Tax=Phenylobacterium sp. TaxID=1871053 RepID=UPI001A49A8CF|nr:hypothetical protein [Phenylobacterium sp.]MBL8770718.1 hypothetical protein [Phenylobacterium sp.]